MKIEFEMIDGMFKSVTYGLYHDSELGLINRNN